MSLFQVNVWRNLTEEIGLVKRVLRYDLREIDNGIVYPLSFSGIMGYSSFFKLQKKSIDYALKFLDESNIKESLEYRFYYDF